MCTRWKVTTHVRSQNSFIFCALVGYCILSISPWWFDFASIVKSGGTVSDSKGQRGAMRGAVARKVTGGSRCGPNGGLICGSSMSAGVIKTMDQKNGFIAAARRGSRKVGQTRGLPVRGTIRNRRVGSARRFLSRPPPTRNMVNR